MQWARCGDIWSDVSRFRLDEQLTSFVFDRAACSMYTKRTHTERLSIRLAAARTRFHLGKKLRRTTGMVRVTQSELPKTGKYVVGKWKGARGGRLHRIVACHASPSPPEIRVRAEFTCKENEAGIARSIKHLERHRVRHLWAVSERGQEGNETRWESKRGNESLG